eukprot:m.3485 g.3485  ORF g.3485 m.3485 type:complete len:764 (+) comp9467_c0_seq1:103-2394(+)
MSSGARDGSMAKPGAENGTKPDEVFRKDLISAMKLSDAHALQRDEYYVVTDQWKMEWERGVQVCANEEALLHHPKIRKIGVPRRKQLFRMPKARVRTAVFKSMTLRYIMDYMDACWLEKTRRRNKTDVISEDTLEKAVTTLELSCHENLVNTIATEEKLGIEYDASIVCDVCREPDGEDGNEMIFCDSCNVCVHQACYGVRVIPEGNWLCRSCSLRQAEPKCLLCPNIGGAFKPVKFKRQWCHVSCALWVPEVGIGNVERMEPLTKIEMIPQSRWNLVCVLCKEKSGACIQCSVKSCTIAYHVTCAMKHGLYMKTMYIPDARPGDCIQHISHCPKHSVNGQSSPSKGRGNQGGESEDLNLRKTRLQCLQEKFYELVSVVDVKRSVMVSDRVANLLFNYWKMKRVICKNHPLVKLPDPQKEADERKRQNQADFHPDSSPLGQEEKIDLEKFLTLRTDMEKARNLTYMLVRRERVKCALSKMRQTIAEKRLEMAEKEAERQEQKREAVAAAAAAAAERLASLPSENGIKKGKRKERKRKYKERASLKVNVSGVGLPSNPVEVAVDEGRIVGMPLETNVFTGRRLRNSVSDYGKSTWDSVKAISSRLDLKQSCILEEAGKDGPSIDFTDVLDSASDAPDPLQTWMIALEKALRSYRKEAGQTNLCFKIFCSIEDELERLLQYTFPKRAHLLLRTFRLRTRNGHTKSLETVPVYSPTSPLDSPSGSPPSGDSSGEVVGSVTSSSKSASSRRRLLRTHKRKRTSAVGY